MTDLGPEARAILDAGRAGDDPAPRDRARLRAAVLRSIAAGGVIGAASSTVGVGVGEGVAAGAQQGAAGGATLVHHGASALLALSWKVAAGLAIAGAVYAGVTTWPGARERPATTLPDARERPAPTLPGARERPAPEPAPTSLPSARERPAIEPAPTVPGARERPAIEPGAVSPATLAAAPVEDTLAAETRRLGEAHGALQDGDPARALALLDAQSTTYADGQLREERAAARVLALCKLGRIEDAAAARARFFREYPRSPLSDRVRASCAPVPDGGAALGPPGRTE